MGGNIASQTRGGMAGAFIGFGFVGVLPLHAWVLSFTTLSVVSFLAVLYAWRVIPETYSRKDACHHLPKYVFPEGYQRVLVFIFLAAFVGAVIEPCYLIYLRECFGLELYALAVGVGAALGPLASGLIYDGLGRDYLFYFRAYLDHRAAADAHDGRFCNVLRWLITTGAFPSEVGTGSCEGNANNQ